MDILMTTIEEFLNTAIPSGATHATEWYTLNEMIAYIFTICLFLGILMRLLRAFRIIESKDRR